MASNEYKNLLSYDFKVVKDIRLSFFQTNGRFFERAISFVEDEDSPVERRAVIAEKCLRACSIEPNTTNPEEIIEQFWLHMGEDELDLAKSYYEE